MVTLSGPQRRALEWLAAYPGVEVGWEPGERAHWTMAWANEDARLHMVGVLAGAFGVTEHGSSPRIVPRGATPRLTTPTFETLVHRGFVKPTRHRPADSVMSSQTYWQISLAGAKALNPALSFVLGGLGVKSA